MDNIKHTVSKNIVALRTKEKMTQTELAEKLNYSDKAISKWERGESLPDITVLKEIADLFSVSLDYLVGNEKIEAEAPSKPAPAPSRKNRRIITTMSILLVWLIAAFCFVIGFGVDDAIAHYWLFFVYAVPVSLVLLLIFNSIWFKPRNNYMIISFLMWSVLILIFLNMMAFSIVKPMLFLLGIPGQLIIFLWSRLE